MGRGDPGGGGLASGKPLPLSLFFVARHVDPQKTLLSVKSIVIEKTISQHIKGPIKTIRRLKNGSILFESNSPLASKGLLSLKQFEDGTPIVMTTDEKFNSASGVVKTTELCDLTPEECLDLLQTQGVTHVRPLNAKDPQNVAFVLTFSSADLPPYVRILSQQIRVFPYIPRPIRCYNCQIYGHTNSNCRSPQVCGQCASHGHTANDCQKPPLCAACFGPHPVTSNECPKYKERVQNLKSIIYRQRAGFLSQQPTNQTYYPMYPSLPTKSNAAQPNQPSYANVTSTQKTLSTQPTPVTMPVQLPQSSQHPNRTPQHGGSCSCCAAMTQLVLTLTDKVDKLLETIQHLLPVQQPPAQTINDNTQPQQEKVSTEKRVHTKNKKSKVDNTTATQAPVSNKRPLPTTPSTDNEDDIPLSQLLAYSETLQPESNSVQMEILSETDPSPDDLTSQLLDVNHQN